MPYLVMLADEEERDKILGAGYEHAFHHEISETLANEMGFAIWLPGDPMDWLDLEEDDQPPAWVERAVRVGEWEEYLDAYYTHEEVTCH